MRCEDSYLIVRVVYKNPVQQAFSGLSLCLIKNEKWKNLKIQKNIIYSYLGRESNQKSIIYFLFPIPRM